MATFSGNPGSNFVLEKKLSKVYRYQVRFASTPDVISLFAPDLYMYVLMTLNLNYIDCTIKKLHY